MSVRVRSNRQKRDYKSGTDPIASSSLMYCSCLPFLTFVQRRLRSRRGRARRFPASDDEEEGQQQRRTDVPSRRRPHRS